MKKDGVIDEVENLYRVVALHPLRRTPGVSFDVMMPDLVPRVDAVDRVIHTGAALSPGTVGDVERPWYMHTHQADNLLVLHGVRYVDVYTHEHGAVESFEVAPDLVKHGGRVVHEGPCLLVWPRYVFHRIQSHPELGSASVNLATHYPGFDIETNFSIYAVDFEARTHSEIRRGAADQM